METCYEYKRNNTFFYISIKKCEIKKNPACKTDEEVEEWIKYRNLLPLVINKSPDFGSFDSIYKEEEIYVDDVKLGPHKFTDTGYRFRINDYKM